jgi:hypothetical protein
VGLVQLQKSCAPMAAVHAIKSTGWFGARSSLSRMTTFQTPRASLSMGNPVTAWVIAFKMIHCEI